MNKILIPSFQKINESNYAHIKQQLLNKLEQNHFYAKIRKYSDVANVLKLTVVGGLGESNCFI